jgi:damage-control phosphatase, subfamily I
VKTCLDCIPCFYRQVIETSRRAGIPEKKIKGIVCKTGKIIAGINSEQSPPEISGLINSYIVKKFSITDVYADAKKLSNNLALGAYDGCT